MAITPQQAVESLPEWARWALRCEFLPQITRVQLQGESFTIHFDDDQQQILSFNDLTTSSNNDMGAMVPNRARESEESFRTWAQGVPRIAARALSIAKMTVAFAFTKTSLTNVTEEK